MRGRFLVSEWPQIVASPEVGGKRPVSSEIAEVLPAHIPIRQAKIRQVPAYRPHHSLVVLNKCVAQTF